MKANLETSLKPGDLVKFKTPMTDEDPNQRYILVDDPAESGPRVDIQVVCDLAVKPVVRVNVNEIETATT
jgi:ACT domain-containing protein